VKDRATKCWLYVLGLQKVGVKDGDQYPNYGLYYYYEGVRQPLDPLKRRMTGAPVIFVPGNAGSYKQVRQQTTITGTQTFRLFALNIISNLYWLNYIAIGCGFEFGTDQSNNKRHHNEH